MKKIKGIAIIHPAKCYSNRKVRPLEGNASDNGAIMSKDYTKPTDGTLNYKTDAVTTATMRGGGEVNITSLTATSAEGTFYIIAHNSAGKDAFVENGTFKGTVTGK